MNPIINAAIDIMSQLKRKCPKCQKEQWVPPNKIDKKVQCKYCGAEIPPRK